MIIIGPDSFRTMAWKNGLGTTTELYRADGLDSQIDWRVSIASIAADGPFSPFPAYDRHIMALDGAGMILEGGPDGPISVAPAFSPATFSGDWPISARLLDTGFRDFNLIVRRSFGRGELSCALVTGSLQIPQDSATCLLFCVSGGLTSNGQHIAEGAAVVLSPGEGGLFEPLGRSVRIALCRIWKTLHS